MIFSSPTTCIGRGDLKEKVVVTTYPPLSLPSFGEFKKSKELMAVPNCSLEHDMIFVVEEHYFGEIS